MKQSLFAVTLITTTMLYAPAYAEDEAALKARIADLEAKVSRLEKLVEKVDTAQKVAAVEPAAGGDKKTDDIAITFKPAPYFESADGEFAFGLRGKLQMEAVAFNDDVVDQPNASNIRRARLGVAGKMYGDWNYLIEVEFANRNARLTDAFLSYAGIKNWEFTAGQFKEPFGMEEVDSDDHVLFNERSLAVAFAPSRHIGFAAQTYGENWMTVLGVFGDPDGTSRADDETIAFTGRATYAPIYEKDTKAVHLGAAASYRVADDETQSVRFRSKPESDVVDLYAVDTGNITGTDDVTLLGLEAGAAMNSIYVQGEYNHASVDRTSGADADFDGWYAQASYVLTGENYGYNVKKGIFERIKPDDPVSFENGGWGAWEIAARYSTIDLTDDVVTGGGIENVTLGINWYMTANTRLSFNYTKVNTDADAVTPNDDPDIFSLRAQMDF